MAWTRYTRPAAELDPRYFSGLWSTLSTAEYIAQFVDNAAHVACAYEMRAAEQQALAIAA